MGQQSAGMLMYRRGAAGVEVFLVHTGGPLWTRRDAGAWTLPKGEIGPGEETLAVALREFLEETGRAVEECATSTEPPFSIGSVVQHGGKTVHAFAFAGDWPEGAALQSNEFEMEWPPRSGRRQRFPEVDRGGFYAVEQAREKINPAQAELLDRLLDRLARADPGAD